jgi:hypothetical protein
MVIFHGYVRKNQRVSDESRSSWALALPQSPWRSWGGPGAAEKTIDVMLIGGIITKPWLIKFVCRIVDYDIYIYNIIIMIYAIDKYNIIIYI